MELFADSDKQDYFFDEWENANNKNSNSSYSLDFNTLDYKAHQINNIFEQFDHYNSKLFLEFGA